jgi:predicted NUDIX family NTP pyrophosphohydrolase
VPRQSAGILLYRFAGEASEVLLVHPGGPFWARKDAGVWSIPKGEYDDTEDPLACALREFEEETGTALDPEEPVELGSIKQRSGKVVTAWAAEGDLDADSIASNTFTMEWPPRSGTTAEFPEVDRAGWFSLDEAREKLNPAQVEFVDRLADWLDAAP